MNLGDPIAPLERTLGIERMVAYAGATWDWHPMHYDRDAAAAIGLASPVVDGQMLGALMAEHLLDHLGPRAFVTSLGFRFRAMVFAGETVRVEGEIASVAPEEITVAQRVLVGDRLAADGTATVRVQ